MKVISKKEKRHQDRKRKARRKRFVVQLQREATARGMSVKELQAERYNENVYARY